MSSQAHLALRGVLRMFAFSCAILFVAVFAALPSVALAKDGRAAKQAYDLPAGDAEKTLKLFTQQSGEQILYPPTKVSGIQTNAVKGEMTPGEVLYAMLDKTQLVAVRDEKTGAYTVQKAATVAEAEKNGSSRPVSNRAAGEEITGTIKLDTFEVMGTKLLNMDIKRSRDDAQPYVIFDRSAIERSGATNLEDFLKQRLTMNTQAASSGLEVTTGYGGSQINLRGLGTNQTLILVDGHRMPQTLDRATPMQPNINGLPLAAIERVEVLPATASGIYGGNAIGGVVNIVLRRDYAGAEIRLTYENTFHSDAASRRVDLSFGATLNGGKTNILAGVSYVDRNLQFLQDLDLVQRGRAVILANNPNLILTAATPPLGSTTNIRSVSGANLVLKAGAVLNSPITSVPVGYAGPASDNGAALVANAGRYNLDLAATSQAFGGRRVIATAPKIESAMAAIRHQFTPYLQAFGDFGASNTTERHPALQFTGSYTLAGDSPINPFTERIRVVSPITASGYNEEALRAAKDRRAVLGLIAKLPGEWLATIDYTWVKSSTVFRQTATSTPPQAATAVSNGSLNVMRDINAYPLDWSPYLAPSFYTTSPFETITRETTLRIAGSVAELPAGTLMLSSMAQYRQDVFGNTTAVFSGSSLLYPSRSQETESIYMEFGVPLLARNAPRMLLRGLDLQLAGRFDRTTTNGATGVIINNASAPVRVTSKGDSFNPTIALHYQPMKSVALRASFSKGFRVPGVNELVISEIDGNFVSVGIDPKRGNTLAGPWLNQRGGNPNLIPEKSAGWSAGVVLTPESIPGLRVSIDWNRVKKTDNITNLNFQQVIDNEAILPGRIVRAANLPGDLPGWAGPITLVDTTLINIAKAEIEAYDVQIDYERATQALGHFEFYGVATWQTHYLTQLLPGAPFIESVGISSTSALKFKANAGLLWKLGRWTFGWNSRYFNSYQVSTTASTLLTQGHGGRVKEQIYHDVSVETSLGRPGSGPHGLSRVLSRTTLQLGVKNVFDRQPPFDANSLVYYSPFGDPRGISYYLSLKKQF